MTTNPTMHDLLKVSAAVGAETGPWSKDSFIWLHRIGYSWDNATADDLDAQVGRLVKRLVELGCSNDWDADGWNWIRYDNPLVEHPDYNTAVYLAAEKVKGSK